MNLTHWNIKSTLNIIIIKYIINYVKGSLKCAKMREQKEKMKDESKKDR